MMEMLHCKQHATHVDNKIHGISINVLCHGHCGIALWSVRGVREDCMKGSGGWEVGGGGSGAAFLEGHLDQSWDPKPPPKPFSKALYGPA